MRTFAYVRVSTTGQTTENHVREIQAGAEVVLGLDQLDDDMLPAVMLRFRDGCLTRRRCGTAPRAFAG
jgi:hypothetical protein